MRYLYVMQICHFMAKIKGGMDSDGDTNSRNNNDFYCHESLFYEFICNRKSFSSSVFNIISFPLISS